MARQLNDIISTGRKGNLVFYEMESKGYVRRISSLNRKQFITKACFEASRQSAARFAMGNTIASSVYRSLPVQKRNYVLFCKLKSKAILLLKQGLEPETVQSTLQAFLQTSADEAHQAG